MTSSYHAHSSRDIETQGHDGRSAFAATTLRDATQAGEKAGDEDDLAVDSHQTLWGTPIELEAAHISARGADMRTLAKGRLIDEALLQIGMGRYQYRLLSLTALAWFLDYVSRPLFRLMSTRSRRRC